MYQPYRLIKVGVKGFLSFGTLLQAGHTPSFYKIPLNRMWYKYVMMLMKIKDTNQKSRTRLKQDLT